MTQAICFGEVLWDLLPEGAKPGGAPMNVAYHLNRLSKKAALISKIGDDEPGKDLINFMQQHRVPTSLLQQDKTMPTGTVRVIPGTGGDVSYDIVKPVAYDYIDFNAETKAAVSAASHFIFGSLAARSAHSRDSLFELIASAQTKVLDINLRPPHYEQTLLEQLLQKADILKLNVDELEIISGWHADISAFRDQVRLLGDRYEIPQIVVTRGASGACYFDGESFFEHPGFRVIVKDTVGCGDAFLAGFLSPLIDDRGPEDCLDFASRLGAFVATQEGACPDYDPALLFNVP
jgi:fructokinase